jgi:hypothetical protein
MPGTQRVEARGLAVIVHAESGRCAGRHWQRESKPPRPNTKAGSPSPKKNHQCTSIEVYDVRAGGEANDITRYRTKEFAGTGRLRGESQFAHFVFVDI